MFEMRNRFNLQTPKNVVNQRLEMVYMRLNENKPVKEILFKFQISRPVFYKHLNRYKEYGKMGVYNLSRAPLNNGRKTPNIKTTELLNLYNKYPFFSSYELNKLVSIPPATIQRILKRKKCKKIYKSKSEKKKLLEKLKKELRQKRIQKKSQKEF